MRGRGRAGAGLSTLMAATAFTAGSCDDQVMQADGHGAQSGNHFPDLGIRYRHRPGGLGGAGRAPDRRSRSALLRHCRGAEIIGIELGRQNVPDAMTLLRFRPLLGQHDLTAAIPEEVNAHLSKRGLLMGRGTVADATNVAAPRSTKHEEGRRDTEMHQAEKGNQWRFGMTMHTGGMPSRG